MTTTNLRTIGKSFFSGFLRGLAAPCVINGAQDFPEIRFKKITPKTSADDVEKIASDFAKAVAHVKKESNTQTNY